MRRLNAVVDDDEAASRAISSRTSNRYGAGWLQRKLGIARSAATSEAMRAISRCSRHPDRRPWQADAPCTSSAVLRIFVLPQRGLPKRIRGRLSPRHVRDHRDAGHYTMLETPVRVASIIENTRSRT